ncbi:gamma-aminobutyric acid receptor subunit beta-1-like isoform X2 [Orbicella faveolata]|uniref:gamma-aminobutyric acid receptor subunit beta-1-like isoform X2 n=1 Tax=Orbicella faveolata TaxID=48498 RepID=UPI0009E3C694|nr:gamma-aminobutyric acid receptor subunit beta-1-like isoform X2 [Orbicella faveolata]
MNLVILISCGISGLIVCPWTLARSRNMKSEVTSQVLSRLLDSRRYDSRLRPNYADGPVLVKVGFWILSIEKIDVANMDYTIDIFLRQEWIDKRLNHGLNQSITLTRRVMKKVWVPDSYFVNAKTGSMHRVTTPNMMLLLGPSGVVKYNIRATIKAACSIDLRMFPMDSQVCPLILESYGYNNKHIRYEWEVSGTDGQRFVPSGIRLMPNYMLTNVNLSLTTSSYVVGNYSGVRADFTFKRSYSYFLSHMYGTSSVIVVISWMGFVVPVEQTAARIALGITSLLTEVTILNMMNNSMPKVSYVKSSDKYLIGCFVFVFLTLIEYCALLLLKAKQKQRNVQALDKTLKQVTLVLHLASIGCHFTSRTLSCLR